MCKHRQENSYLYRVKLGQLDAAVSFSRVRLFGEYGSFSVYASPQCDECRLHQLSRTYPLTA